MDRYAYPFNPTKSISQASLKGFQIPLNRDVAEEVDPYFAGGLADDLIEAGLDDAQVSKTVRSVIRAVEATGDLLDVCNEVERKGYPDIASEIWNIHLASLITVIPKQRREKYMKIILKIAKGMEG